MKWIKHFSNAHDNLKFEEIIDKFGWEGYAYYWVLLELVAEQGTNFRLPSGKCWKIKGRKLFKVSNKKFDNYLNLLAKNKLISKKALNNGTLSIPKMQEYADEYTRKVRSNSRHAPDKLPLEEEENRIEQKKKKKFFYDNLPLIQKKDKSWWVIHGIGDWRKFVGNTKDIEER